MKQAITGNAGPKVRSDIEVTLELTETGGIELNLNRKVKIMYGMLSKSSVGAFF